MVFLKNGIEREMKDGDYRGTSKGRRKVEIKGNIMICLKNDLFSDFVHFEADPAGKRWIITIIVTRRGVGGGGRGVLGV